jgi:UrcA family protein
MKTFLPFAALLFTTAGLAHADDVTTVTGTAPRVEQVRYQTSELASDAGVRGLRSRVRLASYRVCAPEERTNMANYSELFCFSPTVRNAMAQVDRAIAQTRAAAGSAGAASIAVRAQ